MINEHKIGMSYVLTGYLKSLRKKIASERTRTDWNGEQEIELANALINRGTKKKIDLMLDLRFIHKFFFSCNSKKSKNKTWIKFFFLSLLKAKWKLDVWKMNQRNKYE